MKSLADRLKETREAARLSQSELARRAGVSQSTINNIESGRNQGSKHLFAIAGALGVNPTWLAEERGDQFADAGASEPDSEAQFEFSRRMRATTSNPHSEYFPLYEYSIPDGDEPRWIAKLQGLYVPRETLAAMHRKRMFPIRAIAQRDSSMAPMMYPGDIVLIDTEAISVRDTGVYAIYFEGELIFRQALKQIGGSIALRSLDPHRYPDKIVPADMLELVRIVGEVIYRAGPLPSESA